MVDFRKVAKRVTSLSDIMTNREKITNEDLIGAQEYATVHITDMDRLSLEDNQHSWIYTTEEYPNYYAYAGTVLNKIFEEYLTYFPDDVDALRAEFNKAGGITVELSYGTTKKGNDIIKVKVV